MLQQTTIPHATRYFLEFTRRWGNVHELAAANRDDIMEAWAGLGYYSRARNLYACAQLVSEMGDFPASAADLQKLPGIGPYSSGAIAAIAFDEPVAAVDGNVERVVTRFYALETPLPSIKKDIKAIVQDWVPQDRPGDFAQAMMDLGATVCKPRSPDCLVCPVKAQCEANRLNTQGAFPVKLPKKAKPIRRGAVLLAFEKGALIAERREESGLLAGTLGLPTTKWTEIPKAASEVRFEFEGEFIGRVEHVFTHFRLLLDVYASDAAQADALIKTGEKYHIAEKDIPSAGFPSVFRKALNLHKSLQNRGSRTS